jgi:nucleoside 2-deoxyribosyltransferase
MWFDESLSKAFEDGFSKAIRECKFEVMKIDLKEHNNKIDDEIIAEIRNSAFLVADFTGHRGGVYFEAGFALGLGIPVIWCCHVDQLPASHFDTRQYNHIEWREPDELYRKLVNRIRATIL